MVVTITRIPPIDEHDRQKWVRLLGKVEGAPESTWKARTVNVAAIVSGRTTVDQEKARLTADVEEYYARWLALGDIDL